MMSSIHALQSSTTREKLLKSVLALRPFLCESLQNSGFDPFDYTNGNDVEHDAFLQSPHFGKERDSLIQNQNSGNLGSEQHGMNTHDQGREHQVHMIYEQGGGTEGNAQYHVDHADEGPTDAAHTHQQYNHIGCGHNAIVHDEDNGDLYGYVLDDFDINDLVPDQCMGYGHEANGPSLANMPELSTDIPDMLCSLEPIMCLPGMHSLTSLGFSSQDDCKFPPEETLQPILHPHNLYSYTHLRSQQEFQHYPQCPDIIDGTAAASMYNIDLYAHEARCNDNAINQLPIASTPVFLSAASVEAQVTKTTCAKSASLSPSQQRKKRRTKPLPDTNAKRNRSFDETNALEDDGDNCSNPNAAKASGFSSNLVCERRRRQKINEALYALRSVVPNVSKMDKASIMSDALTYAKQLRNRVDDLRNDIRNLQVGKDDVDRTSIDEHGQEESSGSSNKGMDFEKYLQSLPKHKILELGVFNMENNMYHLRICCEKGPGDLLQLTRVIEALNFNILNSSVASVGNQSTINTVVKVDIDEVLKPEEVKEMMLDIVNKYGLHV